MRIKNLKYALSTAFLLITLSLTGCASNRYVSELKSSIESLQDENKELKNTLESLQNTNVESSTEEIIDIEIADSSIEETLVEIEEIENAEVQPEIPVLESYEITSLVNEISDELGWNAFHYYKYSSPNKIEIDGRRITQKELTDDFYTNLNLLLSQNCDYRLELSKLENEIDFSKLNLTNIKELDLNRCGNNFDYDTFSNQSYNTIRFYDISSENSIKIVERNTNNEIKLIYSTDSYIDSFKFVQFLVENNICIDSLYQYSYYEESDVDIYNMLGNLNSRDISFISMLGNQNTDLPIDLDLKLNDKIERFSIDFSMSEYPELGNINISSNNSDLYFALRDILFTDNTYFIVPNNIRISLSGNYTDINSFNTLNNVHYLSYFDHNSEKGVFWDNGTPFSEAIKKVQELHGSTYIKK